VKARSIRAKAHKELCETILAALGDEALTAAQISGRISIPSRKLSTTLSSLAKRGVICASQGGYSEVNHAPCVLWGRSVQGCELARCWPMHATLPEGTPGARHVGER
jgi:hypothetical protein